MKCVRGVAVAVAAGAVCMIGPIAVGQASGAEDEMVQSLVRTTFGDVLLHDEASGIVVSVKRTGDRLSSVIVTDTKHTGTGVQVNVRPTGERPEVEYAATTSDKPMQTAVWRDVNSDGVFDFRLLVGNWPQFNNETGPRALVGGKWIPAARAPGEGQISNPTVTVADKPYRFDFAQAEWLPATQEAATPATRPTR